MSYADGNSPNAYIVEVRGQTAGIAVVEARGFSFAASDPIYRRLNGRRFKRVNQIQTAAEETLRLHSRGAGGSAE